MNGDISALLMDHGIRPSPQRLAIMHYLSTHLTHPTVDEVYEALHTSMPTLSKTTIYNTLKLFGEKGIIRVLNVNDHEVHLDAVTTQHAHFTCIECGKIVDVPYTSGQMQLDKELGQSSVLNGYRIVDAQFHFNGICPECQKKNKTL